MRESSHNAADELIFSMDISPPQASPENGFVRTRLFTKFHAIILLDIKKNVNHQVNIP